MRPSQAFYAGVQGGNHSVEGHASATHADHTIGIGADGNLLRRNV